MPKLYCETCDYTAKTKSNLNKHIKTQKHLLHLLTFKTPIIYL